jgi:hypothetical protein
MKKKTVKKLELSKETLKNLEGDKLQEVHGGICRTNSPLSCVSDPC